MGKAGGRNGWPLASSEETVSAVGKVLGGEKEPFHVLVPFCGPGTVPYLCAMKGWKVTGLEPNPFLRWSAFARSYCFGPKAAEYAGYAWERVAEDVFWENEQYRVPRMSGTFGFGTKQEDFLRRLRNMIDRENGEEMNILLKLSLCDVLPRIRGTDEDSFDDRTGSELFSRSVEHIGSSVGDNPKPTAQVHLCDPRDIPFSLRRKYDLIVSELPDISPDPDAETLRTYMQWMGFDDVAGADRRSVGYPLGGLGACMGGYVPDGGFRMPSQLAGTVGNMEEEQGLYVRRFFEGLNRYLATSKELMRPGCRAYYFVREGKVFGERIDVPEIVSSMMENAGLHAEPAETDGRTLLVTGRRTGPGGTSAGL